MEPAARGDPSTAMPGDGSGSPRGPRSATAGPLWPGVAALLAVELLVAWSVRTLPAPRSLDAPPGAFSEARARAVLERVLGDQEPHPVGSAAGRRVAGRIRDELTHLGYEPAVQHTVGCRPEGACAPLLNITALLPGREPGPLVLLSVHHDSVAAGPGASDDGAGVAAALEIARALRSGAPARNGVLFLIDDAEEMGLLGARAFLAGDPRARRIGVVVNAEARGTSGPVAMFQTSPDNLWLLRLLAASSARPFTSSTLVTLYERLPNDTDLSVFLDHGLAGLNFAFADDLPLYHTPRDDLAHLDPRTFQAHGDALLAVLRSLAEADLSAHTRGQAVYFTLALPGKPLVYWPAAWSLPVALLALALLLALAWRQPSLLSAGRRASLAALLAFPAMLAAAVASGLALTRLLQLLRGLEEPWTAHRLPASVALGALAAAAALAVAVPAARTASPLALRLGVSLWWAILAVLTGWKLPGASYLFLVPALGATLGLLATTLRRRDGIARPGRVPCLTAAAAGLVWLPLLHALDIMTGPGQSPGVTLPVALLVTTLAHLVPPSGRTRLPAAALAVAALAFAAALMVPAYTIDAPRHLTFVYQLDHATGRAWWLAHTGERTLPGSVSSALPFERRVLDPGGPWSRGTPQHVAAAEVLPLAPPRFDVDRVETTGSGRVIEGRFVSPRGALDGYVCVRRDRLEAFAVAGQALRGREESGWSRVALHGLPAEGLPLRIEIAGTEPAEIALVDSGPGLPPGGATLLAARPPTAVPLGPGDRTVVIAREVR